MPTLVNLSRLLVAAFLVAPLLRSAPDPEGPAIEPVLQKYLEDGKESERLATLLKGRLGEALDKNKETALHVLAGKGSAKRQKYALELAKQLVLSKATLNAKDSKDRTPMLLALQSGNINMAEFLLSNGASVDVCCRSAYGVPNTNALHLLASSGKHSSILLTAFLKHNLHKQVDGNENSALHLAAAANNVELAKDLLKNGMDPNLPNQTKSSPLFIACREGNVEMLKLLMANGGNVDSRRNDRWSPLHVAAYNGNGEIIGILLESKAKANRKADGGVTALDLAKRRKNMKIVDQLKGYLLKNE